MSSISGASASNSPFAIGESIESRVIDSLKAAKESAEKLDLEKLKNISCVQKFILDCSNGDNNIPELEDNSVEECFNSSGIEEFITQIDGLIENYLNPSQWDYPRNYLTEQEIVGLIQNGGLVRQLKYYVNPGIYGKKTGKFILQILRDLHQDEMHLSGVFGKPQNERLKRDVAVLEEDFKANRSLVLSINNIVNLLKENKTFSLDKQLIAELREFDEAYFSCIELERVSFGKKERVEALVRTQRFISDDLLSDFFKGIDELCDKENIIINKYLSPELLEKRKNVVEVEENMIKDLFMENLLDSEDIEGSENEDGSNQCLIS